MKKPIFTGAGVAIVTPFTGKDLKINFGVLEKLIEFQISNGTDAIVVCGTTGEKSTLTNKEHIEVIKFTVKTVSKRIPVIAGTGSNDTKHSLEISNEVEKLGVDGLLMVTPYYNKTSQDGLLKSFSYIEKNVSTPILLYNVPSRTGVNIKPETYKELSKLKLINGIKEANGNISDFAKTVALCKDGLNYYCGNDDQITAFMSLGAKGVISVLSNILPAVVHDICKFALEKEYDKSSSLQLQYLELCNMLFCDVNPIPVKEALNIIGFDVGMGRMPLTSLSRENIIKLKSTLIKYGLTAGK